MRWPTHRVQGVRRPVRGHARAAADGAPHERPDDRVGRVLGDRLERRAAQPGAVQRGRVAADERRGAGAGAGRVDPAAGDELGQCAPLALERPAAERRPRRRGEHESLGRRPARPALGRSGRPGRGADEQPGVHDPGEAGRTPQAPLQRPGDPPEPGHRVPAPRVAERAVGGDAEREPGGPGRPHPSSAGASARIRPATTSPARSAARAHAALTRPSTSR